MSKPRVILADDHTLLLEAFEKLLAPECDIVAKVGDGRALVAAVQEHHPDSSSSISRCRCSTGSKRRGRSSSGQVRQAGVRDDERGPDLAAEAFRAGGVRVLLKRSAGSELRTAIREAMKHRSYITPLVTEGMLGSLMQPTTEAPPRQLTSRQREVLQLLAEGKSMKEVASILNVTASDGRLPQVPDDGAAATFERTPN